MTPETIAALLNTGTSGALIILMIYMLNFILKMQASNAEYIKKLEEVNADRIKEKDTAFFAYISARDKEQREYFDQINRANKADALQITEVLHKLVAAMDDVTKTIQLHESKTPERIQSAVQSAIEELERPARVARQTKPRPKE